MQFARVTSTKGPSYARLTLDASGRVETAYLLAQAPWASLVETGDTQLAPTLLAPSTPSKVLCVGRNYAAHAKELGNEVPKEPLLFLKPPSSLLDPGGVVVLPPESARVEHEVEVALIVGKRCKNVSPEEAAGYIFGYTCGGDLTARDLQRSDGQWSRAKGFDTFCPLGPFIETDLAGLLGGTGLRVQCTINGEARQDGNTRDMVFGVGTLVSYMSHAMTLEPGDVLLTGTPEGVGPLVVGDAVAMTIEGLSPLLFSIGASPTGAL
jgi:2-keto-4-pentenoate hydratase/2-oxohepta-3-ene-1,7-dioic acid hydratase in catechol pathway